MDLEKIEVDAWSDYLVIASFSVSNDALQALLSARDYVKMSSDAFRWQSDRLADFPRLKEDGEWASYQWNEGPTWCTLSVNHSTGYVFLLYAAD